ncbi:glycosyltransferase [Coxiella burnetii]|uniref:Polyprenyl-phosphate beta-D-mannosyltransferase n=3 Tax=Coxiella burnetii TaxID=777 RepID=B5U8Q5_COXBU|nr:glycosyltransferase [Coxiella burnetii]NP_819720.2 polyprenyl-phosphate beta-D-mannosyltransferase [Coxiella burnetii RSA 493]AAO90234.2 polyprenyl-phosphate beta-D-mannosyltransferase [Coxiella burnetii RSA 493]ACJ18626.1 polyprenyl-phosphate beta-D-mannosyltransferase [Coxiella burnetii CbuG_Q212]ACJ20723.1 polyprenyl-phosphate beta-D-mannosyltransferase [Coxiella burnetii CbuK_Q154]AZV75623.1 glycosyltransferase [Coxiella burnetii]MDE3399883.1 glycosyltransferase [Coxiella burnetii]
MGRLSTMVAERARKSLNRDLKTVDGKIVLDLAVIVPTLNESAVIASVLESIRDNLPSVRYTICVADGGSTDGTVEIVKKMSESDPNIILLHQIKDRPGNQRNAGARMALEWLVKNTSHTVFTEIDSDGAHSAEELMNGVMAVSLLKFDFIIGSKYLYGSKVVGRALYRRFISYCYSFLARILFSRRLRDYSNSYRFYSYETAKLILSRKFSYSSPIYLLEILITCMSNGLKILELPSTYAERNTGNSKIIFTDVIKGFFIMLSIGFKYNFSRYKAFQSNQGMKYD